MKNQLYFTAFLVIGLIKNYVFILPNDRNMYYIITGLIMGFLFIKQYLMSKK